MGSFILKENTNLIIFRGYESGVMLMFKKWCEKNIGCEILGWKQSSESSSTKIIITVMYNKPVKELDDILA